MMPYCHGSPVMTATPFLDVLEELITTVVDPAAAEIDPMGTSPRAAFTALPDVTAPDVIGRALCGPPLFG